MQTAFSKTITTVFLLLAFAAGTQAKEKRRAAGSTPGPIAAASPTSGDPWQAFLHRYLDTTAADGVNRLRYASVTPADRKGLEDHLLAQQAVRVSALAPKARLAYWVNLYNAQTAALVLRAYPVKSIMDISLSEAGRPGGGKQGPWDAKLMKVEDKVLSLNDIENGILRPQFKDPRIHFALNCASLGCPELSPSAYTAANADMLMDKAARAFVGSPHGAAFRGSVLVLSSIFDWYKADFGKDDREKLGFLARYSSPEQAARLRGFTGKIEYRYDWSINASP